VYLGVSYASRPKRAEVSAFGGSIAVFMHPPFDLDDQSRRGNTYGRGTAFRPPSWGTWP